MAFNRRHAIMVHTPVWLGLLGQLAYEEVSIGYEARPSQLTASPGVLRSTSAARARRDESTPETLDTHGKAVTLLASNAR